MGSHIYLLENGRPRFLAEGEAASELSPPRASLVESKVYCCSK